MAEFVSTKMKRKDLETDVFNHFADFSLAAPARKIRRLDGVMPPVVDEKPEYSVVSDGQLPGEHPLGMKDVEEQSDVVINNLDPPVSLNERSLALYKPVNSPPCLPLLDLKNPVSTCISVSVNTGIYPDLKYLLSCRPNTTTLHAVSSRDDLAVIPWVPPSHPPAPAEAAEGGSASDPMESEVTGTQMEEDNPTADAVLKLQPDGIRVEGAQWQQHCMASHPLQTTPVMWSW